MFKYRDDRVYPFTFDEYFFPYCEEVVGNLATFEMEKDASFFIPRLILRQQIKISSHFYYFGKICFLYFNMYLLWEITIFFKIKN